MLCNWNGGMKWCVLFVVVVFVVIGGVVWFGCWWMVGCFIESINDVYLQVDSMIVVLKVVGYVIDVYVCDNQFVKVGDLFVWFDVCQYQVVFVQVLVIVDVCCVDIVCVEVDISQQYVNFEQVDVQVKVLCINVQYVSDEYMCYVFFVVMGVEMYECVVDLKSMCDQVVVMFVVNNVLIVVVCMQIVLFIVQFQQVCVQFEVVQVSVVQV